MKTHVELVKKFLADNTSVTLEELKANETAAYAVWANTDARAVYWAAEGATRAYYRAAWAYEATLWAFRAAESDKLENAEYCKQKAIEAVVEYEELTK